MFLGFLKEIKDNAENALNTVKDSDTFRQASTMVSNAAETAQALAAEKLGEIKNVDSCGILQKMMYVPGERAAFVSVT